MSTSNASDEHTVRIPFQKLHGFSQAALARARASGDALVLTLASASFIGTFTPRVSTNPPAMYNRHASEIRANRLDLNSETWTRTAKIRNTVAEQRARGHFDFQDAEYAAEILVSLVIGDQQVRRLLGSLSEPGPIQIEERAELAVEAFLKLFGSD